MKKEKLEPFIKWVGGKRQLSKDIFDVIDQINYKNYHEPFVGGGAIFIEMINKERNVKSINDFNADLINCYTIIRDDVEKLIKKLKKYQKEHTRFKYYSTRDIDRNGEINKISKIDKAARFIYLNKTSFNGIYRVNSKGEYNVPIGAIWNKRIFNEQNLLNLSKEFKNIKITNDDYSSILKSVRKGDLVYFDPPYDIFEGKKNFVSYQKEGFNRENQKELKIICDKLISKGVNIIVSNHNTKFIMELYSDKRYYIQIPVKANRFINSNSKKRKKSNIEIIIYGGDDVKKIK